MHARVSFRLGAVIGLIIFVTVAVSYLSLGRQLTTILTTAARGEMRRDLLLQRQMLEKKPEGWPEGPGAEAWVQRLGRVLELRVTLIAPDGRVVADSYIPRERIPSLPSHALRPEFIEAMKGGIGEYSRRSQSVQEEMLYMAVPLGRPVPYGVLRFSKPLYDIVAFEANIRKSIGQGLFWALFCAAGGGMLAAYFLARPLRTLAETARQRIRGELAIITPSGREDEIGTLDRALDMMAEEITGMRRSEEWYRAVFSGIREAIIVTDEAGQIILFNPAASRVFRIEGAMFRSRPVEHLADASLRELFTRVHGSHEALLKQEMALMTSKGRRIMQLSSMPVLSEGRYGGMVFVLNDITRLRNLERVRRDFVSSVSHELRTPLTSIKGYTETLLDGAMDDPEHARGFLKIIMQESDQLTALVNDVLDLSRIESGRIEYHFAAVDLLALVQKSVDMLRRPIEEKHVKLDIAIPETVPKLHADPAYLEIVVRNLLDNAVKYVDEQNGRVRISAFREGDMVRLEVEDNGIGIAKENLGRIFERFYRVDKARSRKLGGTGLGLAIVKHIVLAHKGTVDVRSRVNQGTVFSMVIPAMPEQEG
ncbi:MAG: ATP-binding protein [Chlorobiaceae bacterium]